MPDRAPLPEAGHATPRDDAPAPTFAPFMPWLSVQHWWATHLVTMGEAWFALRLEGGSTMMRAALDLAKCRSAPDLAAAPLRIAAASGEQLAAAWQRAVRPR